MIILVQSSTADIIPVLDVVVLFGANEEEEQLLFRIDSTLIALAVKETKCPPNSFGFVIG